MNRSKIIYFIPTFYTDNTDEIKSVKNIIEIIENNSDLKINLCLGWNKLIELFQDQQETNLLIVFRLDFLERRNMELDEVLYMLSSLIKFLVKDKTINLAIVVRDKCKEELIIKFKRNGVLGVIPGIRFFEKQNSITAYDMLSQGRQHWPELIVEKDLNRVKIKQKNIKLTNRQYEIFNLISRMGLSNKKISQQLNIKEDTVKYHVGNILKLYGLQNRNQLILCNHRGSFKPYTKVEEYI